jgi:hypothetical protein
MREEVDHWEFVSTNKSSDPWQTCEGTLDMSSLADAIHLGCLLGGCWQWALRPEFL